MIGLANFLLKISPFIGIIGIVFYYLGIPLAVYICAIILIINSILNCICGGQNSLATEIITFFAGGIIALIFKCNFFSCVAVAFCYAEVIFTIPALYAAAKLFCRMSFKRK